MKGENSKAAALDVRRALVALGIVLLLIGGLASCARKAPPPEPMGPPPEMMESEGAVYDEEVLAEATVADAAKESRAVGPSASGVAHAASERKLIRTAELSLTHLEDVEKTVGEVEKIAREAGGFVGSTSLSRYEDGGQHGSVTVRVPVAKFEQVLSKLRELGRVECISTNVQDVTAEYVDLEARIRNAKREEQEVLKLFDRGGKLADIIQIEKRLSEVRETIERYEGSMRVMRDQVELSTITVQVYQKGEAAVPESRGYDIAYHFRSATRSLVLLLQGVFTFALYFVMVGWVFWLPLGLLIWFIRRRRRARREALEAQQAAGEGQ